MPEINFVKILFFDRSKRDASALFEVISACIGTQQIDQVTTQSDFDRALKQHHYDIVLYRDINKKNQIEQLIALCRQHVPYMPFIVITDNLSIENIRTMHALGVSDVVDEHQPNRLEFSLHRTYECYQLKTENALVQKKIREKIIESSLVYEITLAILSANTLDDALQTYIDRICPMIGWPVGHVFVSDEPSKALISSKIWYLESNHKLDQFKQVTENIHFKINEGLPGAVWSSKKAIWIDDITQDSDFIRSKMCQRLDLKTAIAIPVISNETIIAIIEFFSYQKETNKHNLIQIFELFADHISFMLDKKKSDMKVAQLLNIDTLTGLPNRAQMIKKINASLLRSQQSKKRLVLLLIDIDNFNQINESLSRSHGDLLLKKISEEILKIPEIDFISRIGGNTFAILLENITASHEAADLAQTILSTLNKPHHINGKELNFTASIGIAINTHIKIKTETLLENAETALYQVKQQGKNNYQFFTKHLNQKNSRRILLENHLRHALDRRELSLVYQPIMALATGQPVGVEALLRWHNQELGTISPDEFIPIAEATGLINPIGNWIIDTALHDFSGLYSTMKNDAFFLNINCSVIQLKSPQFINFLNEQLIKNNVPRSNIFLEITETSLMENLDELSDSINKIKQLGVYFAIDDFGTGYSSLSYLKQLPINVLKIDKSFIDDIPNNSNDISIADAIIKIGTTLELKIIAEGIERPEQQACLKGLHCHYAQGYLYSKPLPIQDLIDFLNL